MDELVKILVVGAIAAALAIAFPGHAQEKVFQPPDIEGYTLFEVTELDKDDPPDGVKETRLEIYEGRHGARVGKYITERKVWAYAALGNPKNIDDSTKNYAIVDSDGDGIFDQRFRYRGEEFYLPRWLKGARSVR